MLDFELTAAEEMRTYVCTPASLAAFARARLRSRSIFLWASTLPAAAFVVPSAERNIEEPFGYREGHVSESFASSEVSLGDSVGSLRRAYADTEKLGCARRVERI